MVTVSAPGKVHLIGEHAVVYNEPAILAAVGLRCHVKAEKGKDPSKVRIVVRDGYESEHRVEELRELADKVDRLWSEGKEKGDFSEPFAFLKEDWKRASQAFAGKIMKTLGITEGFELEMWTTIPLGSGLGSSSALAVSMTQAISDLFRKDLSKEKVNDIAFTLEQYMHGTPSGADNAATAFGGMTWFQKGEGGPTIRSLAKEVPHSLENFVLVYAGKPEKSTGELVQMVAQLPEEKRNPLMRSIGEMVPSMLEAMKEKDYPTIKDVMNKTWDNLHALGLSTPNIDKIVSAVRALGGAAKGCGAVGGGVVLCYHEDKELLLKTLKELGFDPWEADLAVEGVRVDG